MFRKERYGMKKKVPIKTVYYKDELQDEFSTAVITPKKKLCISSGVGCRKNSPVFHLPIIGLSACVLLSASLFSPSDDQP